MPYNKNVSFQLEEHTNELDGIVDDMKIPLNDIFLQEFFFYGYCIVTKDRRAFFESDEGHTYVKMVHQ